jgi:Methionine biosynthesis protein MetW
VEVAGSPWGPGYSRAVPPAESPTSSMAANGSSSLAGAEAADTLDPAEYLVSVMADIDAEVRRRRASGDLPAGLERELDELFLEFSPVGLHSGARLRETLALVDSSAYVDMAVPVESQKLVGSYVKRLIRKTISWYMGFIVHQIVKFAWAVSRMFHVVVDRIEGLEAAVDGQRTPELPTSAVPEADAGPTWWSAGAVAALTGTSGRVVHGECGSGFLLEALAAAGTDAYGVDPNESAIESAVTRGLDARAESVLDHLDVVADESLSGIVLSGSVQWLHPNERDRLTTMVASRLDLGGVLVLHSMTPEAWTLGRSRLLSDLAPGRPLHAETWEHLLAQRGFGQISVTFGSDERRLDRVPSTNPDASAINGAIDVVNALLLGPGDYLLIAVRER